GTIPDRGLYMVTLPDGRRVGELDEEMVYEARPGQTFLLGASSWRIEEIGRDRVVVTPASGARRSWARRSADSRAPRSTAPSRSSPPTTTSTSSPHATCSTTWPSSS